MWVLIVSREPLGDGSRSLHFIILLSCAIAQRMHGVCTCDSLLGSDVAPTSTRHKEYIKTSTIFNYFHCRHGYVTLPLQDGSSTFIIEKANRFWVKNSTFISTRKMRWRKRTLR